MAHPRMAAGALFFGDAGRVLLVEPSYKDYRDIPGGYVERGESPLRACTREIHEELGIKASIGRLLVVDWAPNPGEGDKVLYLFDGGRLSADHRRQVIVRSDELRGYDFHHADRLPELTVPRLVRRISAGIQARANGLTVYLEHGEPPQAES
ncbi:NUDIX domain-containing protein [Streptomyces albipurpureus]|uniref:NUDIX hydrolase n=1 Tax=Streptomyces albipurpureus TaxID=2897419 RepID=A0ABT0V1V5_9ACTN|nr:NUDIX hydrolase [Streptomyces sp. CWNU-1]MCM2393371.1 NUDIX hydrolase [Streptomyces sp. CWNU-1]